MKNALDYRTRLMELRLDHKMTQKDVAEVCGISDATVGHWENLKRHVSLSCLTKLCAHYGVSADFVLGLPQGMDYPDR